MATHLTLSYDKEGDILHVAVIPENSTAPFDFLADGLVARYDRDTRVIEHLDILGFAARFKTLNDVLELPVEVSMRLLPEADVCD